MTISTSTMGDALRELQRRSIRRRRRAASRLVGLSFAPNDYPAIDPAKVRELEHLVQDATQRATDAAIVKRVMKQNAGFGSAFPGYVPLLICIFLQFTTTPHQVLGWSFAGATVFLLFWSLRLTNRGFEELNRPAVAALELAKELGLA